MSSQQNQSSVDALAIQNRTLSHTLHQVKRQLANEEERRKTIVNELNAQWQAEKASWAEMQQLYHIHQLRLLIQFEGAEVSAAKEKNIRTTERLDRNVKEAEALLSRREETRLKWRVADLEQELESMEGRLLEVQDDVVIQYQAFIERLKKKCVEFAHEAKRKSAEVATIQQERNDLEAELTELKSEHSTLSVTFTTISTQLERVSSELEDTQTTLNDLKRQCIELERDNASLKRQLEKRNDLEGKGEAKAELERKRRADLEARVKELEANLKDKEKLENLLEKERRRIDKFKASAVEWQDEINKSHTEAETAVAMAKEAQKQQARLQKRIDKLEAQLDEEHEKANKRSQSAKPTDEVDSESVVEVDPLTTAESQTSGKPKSKGHSRRTAKKDEDQSGKNTIGENARGRRTRERKAQRKPESRDKKTGDGDGSRTPIGGSVDESAEKQISTPDQTKIHKDDDENDEKDPQPPTRKKKRKLNNFPSSQPAGMQLDFGAFNFGDGQGLNIPDALSPVKVDEAPQGKPTRSTSLLSRVESAIGGFVRR